MEMPAAFRHRRAHLKAPAPEDVKGDKVIFDQLVAPVPDPADDGRDLPAYLRDGWIESARMRQSPLFRIRRSLIKERPDPEPRPGPQRLHFRGQRSHIGKPPASPVPGPAVIAVDLMGRLPAVVDHHVGNRPAVPRETRDPSGVTENRFFRDISVGIVPVVASDHGARRQKRVIAHRPAEGRGGVHRRHPVQPAHDHLRHRQRPSAEPDALRAVPHIKIQRQSPRIQLPEAESRGPHPHAGAEVAGGSGRLFLRQQIPGHRPVRRHAPPLEISVSPLPRVAQHPPDGAQIRFKAEDHPADRLMVRFQLNQRTVLRRFLRHPDARVPEAVGSRLSAEPLPVRNHCHPAHRRHIHASPASLPAAPYFVRILSHPVPSRTAFV